MGLVARQQLGHRNLTSVCSAQTQLKLCSLCLFSLLSVDSNVISSKRLPWPFKNCILYKIVLPLTPLLLLDFSTQHSHLRTHHYFMFILFAVWFFSEHDSIKIQFFFSILFNDQLQNEYLLLNLNSRFIPFLMGLHKFGTLA